MFAFICRDLGIATCPTFALCRTATLESGSKSCDHDGKISYFKPPKEGSHLLSDWNRAIPRKDANLKPSYRVC